MGGGLVPAIMFILFYFILFHFILFVYLPHIHTHTNERRREKDVEMGLMDIKPPRSQNTENGRLIKFTLSKRRHHII